jgi:methionine-rich copper-binding protein CopC
MIRPYDGHQALLAKGGLDSAAAGHRVLKVVPPRLGAGTYTVQWVAVSANDGAVRKGSFKFSVAAAAAAPAGAAAILSQPEQIVPM